MARVSINGNVHSVGIYGGEKTFLKVWENYTDAKGIVKTRLWAVWFEKDLMGEVQQGDFVEITGHLSCRAEKKYNDETVTVVGYNINMPKLEAVKLSAENKAAAEARITGDDTLAPF
jgi:hypothetical protein